MSSHPRRVDHFREWSKLMMEQALVPERPQYKSNKVRSSSPAKNTKRRKRRIRRNRRNRRNRRKQE